MDGINKFLNLHGNDIDIDGLAGGENNVKGLFFDLLSCLGGDKHPMLPQGYKRKPMTGFLDILEAFNEMAKLHNAGSGTVCEVDLVEFDENGNIISGRNRNLESKVPKKSTITLTNTESDIDVQEFVDAEDDELPECKKGKKKQQSKKSKKKSKAAISSSEDEHLWTSCSGSEYEDAN